MNIDNTARFRNRLQQIIDEAQTSPDYDRTTGNHNKIRTKAGNIIGIRDSMIVHCDTLDQPYGRAQHVSSR